VALCSCREGNRELLGHATEDGFVNVLDAVCGAENAYPLGSRCAGGGAGSEAIPVGHEFGLDHAAGFVFTAPPLSENCVNLVDEDDAWLQFPCQTEYCVNELVAVAVPLFCQSRDVQVDEAGARFVREGFCKHSLSATGRTVEEDAAGCAEERGRVRVEVGHGKGVDDGFLEFVDYRVEATDILEAHGNLFRRNNLHGNRLFVGAQVEVLYPRPSGPGFCVVIFAVVLTIAFPPLACKDGVEFTRRSRGFGAGFFFLLSLRVEACEEVTNDEVGYQRLPRCQKVLCRTVRGRADVGRTRRMCGKGRTAAAAMRMSGR
jgi:hypothetical protein